MPEAHPANQSAAKPTKPTEQTLEEKIAEVQKQIDELVEKREKLKGKE